MINVYNKNNEVIAQVEYNNNLDIWNGSNYQRGTGRHLGITKLENGTFVLIHGTQWQGESDYAEIISDQEAFQEIMNADPSLLEEDKFKKLQKFKKQLLQEV